MLYEVITELNPYPTTGLPSRITSVTTAATDTVILLKSMYALRMRDAMEAERSLMSTIFIGPLQFPNAAITAFVTSTVDAVPPRSRVRVLPAPVIV